MLAAHLPPHLSRAVHLIMIGPDAPDDRAQDVVVLRPHEEPRRITIQQLVAEERRQGNRQNQADRLYPVRIAKLVDKCLALFGLWSSCDWAKKAEAFRRITYESFRSKFSRFSGFNHEPPRWSRTGRTGGEAKNYADRIKVRIANFLSDLEFAIDRTIQIWHKHPSGSQIVGAQCVLSLRPGASWRLGEAAAVELERDPLGAGSADPACTPFSRNSRFRIAERAAFRSVKYPTTHQLLERAHRTASHWSSSR